MPLPNVERFPLSWPAGWKRRRPEQRARAAFGVRRTNEPGGYAWKRGLTVADGLDRVYRELRLAGADAVVVSSNVPVRLDGLPRSGQPEPADPGVAVYFSIKGKPYCLACDRWNRAADNLAAVAGHVAATRTMERYGVGTVEQAFAGFAALPPSSEEWWIVLGVVRTAPVEVIQAAYRALARTSHPDTPTGSAAAMARLNAARDRALEERRVAL